MRRKKIKTESRFRIQQWAGHREYDDYWNDGNDYIDIIEISTGLLYLRFGSTWDQYWSAPDYEGAEKVEISASETFVTVLYYDNKESKKVKIPKNPMKNAGEKSLIKPDKNKKQAYFIYN